MIKRSLAVMTAALGLYACSSDDNTTGGTTGGNTAKLTGQMVDYSTQTGEAGWEVSAAGVKATTNAKGVYELAIPKDTFFTLSVTDPKGGHYNLVEQERKISGDWDSGRLRFVGKPVGDVLLGVLKADKTKPVVSVALVALESCKAKAADFPQGAKMTAAGASVVYYKGSPDPTLTEAQGGQDPAGVVFNSAPGAPLEVKVDYAKCTQKAFPVTVDDPTGVKITYNGKLEPQGDTTLTVYRVFFE